MENFNIRVIMIRKKRKLAKMCIMLMTVIFCPLGKIPTSSIKKDEMLNITNSLCVRMACSRLRNADTVMAARPADSAMNAVVIRKPYLPVA